MLYFSDEVHGLGAYCTGSVLNEHWMLTAGHCVSEDESFTITSTRVTFADSWNDTKSGDTADASDWFAHPDFSPATLESDVGLVYFDEALDFPAMQVTDVGPDDGDLGNEFRIVGYGLTGADDLGENPTKRTATAGLSDYDANWLWMRDSAEERQACFGDSGGPVLRLHEDGSYSQAGVTSWTTSCDSGATASARIDAFLDFLDDNDVEFTRYGDAPASYPEHDEIEEESADDGSSSGLGFDEPAATCGGAGWPGLVGIAGALAGVGRRLRRP